MTRTVLALIPAHNEAGTIAATIESLQHQKVVPNSIIVLCDNCTDGTEEIARAAGANTYVTVKNTEMKAGALNQALATWLPTLGDDDLVVAIDADSIVADNFVSEAIKRFDRSDQLGGVSGTYLGKPGGKLAGWAQRNEFARWGFDNRTEKGATVILSGAASIFTATALRKVIAARERGQIKGSGVYDTGTITEDFELSLALKATGSTIVNMLNVLIRTAVKPTWRELHIQRLRWDRGINESLCDYGITRFTWVIWFRRIMYAIFVPVSFLCLGMISMRIVSGSILAISPFWILIGTLMMTQKALTVVKSRGWKNAALAFLILPELPYDTFLQLTFTRSVWHALTNRSKAWR
jgi:poly-beta-1,6-N-acetyl-D-glucosamine synthase